MIRRVLIITYVIVWFLFGIVYYWMANSSNGKAFHFNQDLRLSSQIEAFSDVVGTKVDKDIIQMILKNDSSNRFAIRVKKDGIPEYLYSNQQIGPWWAAYYTNNFKKQGVTHFKADIIDRSLRPLVGLSTVIEGLPSGSGTCYKVHLTLLRGLSDSVPMNEQELKNYDTIIEHTIWTTSFPKTILLENKPIFALTIDFLPELLQNSFNYLDDSLFTVKSILRGEYRYKFLDFLYFSTVTITTLGYGDILPGNTTVRVLVMFEAILGVLLIGGFISSLFWKPINEDQKANRKSGLTTG